MEEYLKEQYNFEDLSGKIFDCDGIIPYFLDNGRDYFDCGQGYYHDFAYPKVYINGKYYVVTVEAELTSQKVEYGDRLYMVDIIKKVTYKEVDKPKEKPKPNVYILLEIDYDENETRKLGFPSITELEKHFGEGDEDILGDLMNDGHHDWEWGSFYLIKAEDFK